MQLLKTNFSTFNINRFNSSTIIKDWTPEQVDSITWNDAADSSTIITGSDGRVSKWLDKSGNNNHAFQDEISKQPLYSSDNINFKRGFLSFDNDVYKYIHKPAVFVVANRRFKDGHEFTNSSIVGDGGDQGWQFRWKGNQIVYTIYRQTHYTGPIFSFSTNFELISGIRSEGNTALNFNGNYNYDLDKIGDINYKDDYVGRSIIGGDASQNNANHVHCFYGSIQELIVVNDVNSLDAIKIEGYLSWKWGLQDKLPVNHVYKNAKPLL